MTPSQCIKMFPDDIHRLEKLLFQFVNERGDYYEQLKALQPTDFSTLNEINQYELEVRIGLDYIQRWAEKK